MKGNLTERKKLMIFSFVLSLPVLACSLFFTLWQTYVLRIEMILCIVALIVHGLELVFGVLTTLNFIRFEHFA